MELRRSNYDDIRQLQNLRATIHQCRSKIYEYAEEFPLLLNLTEKSLGDIEAAINELEETDSVLNAIIDACSHFVKVKFE